MKKIKKSIKNTLIFNLITAIFHLIIFEIITLLSKENILIIILFCILIFIYLIIFNKKNKIKKRRFKWNIKKNIEKRKQIKKQ